MTQTFTSKRGTTILGTPVSNVSLRDALTFIADSILSRRVTTIFPINVNVLMKSRSDDEFNHILGTSDLTPPDGMPVVWASFILGAVLKERVPGWLLFEHICKNGHRVFLLGGQPGIAAQAAENLSRKYDSVRIAGVYAPPYGFENNESENEKIIRMVNESSPDVLFVGLGAPRQEKWITTHMTRMNATVYMAVGGSFDFYAGKVTPPPYVIAQMGLGWFWRLLQEPRRLWRRYLIDDMPFFYHVLKQRVHSNHRKPPPITAS